MHLGAVEIFCLAREPSGHIMLRSNMPSQNLHMRPILRPPSVLNFTFCQSTGAASMKTVRFAFALLALAATAPWQSAKAADVICYNCPPEWADWASMLKAVKTDLNYDIPHDNKNSGQAQAQILAEKSNPVGDIGYFG